MSYCSYCNYFAPTNSRYQRHVNTNKHARNFMLVDAGIQELALPDEPPTTKDDIPDLVRINDDDDDLPELDSAQIVDLPNNDVSTSTDNLPELIDVSLDTFDLEIIPIDESTSDLAKFSYDITSSISQFFDDYPFAFHLLHVIGFFGFIFFKSKLDKNTSVDSK